MTVSKSRWCLCNTPRRWCTRGTHTSTSTLSPVSKANRADANGNTRRPPSGSQNVCGSCGRVLGVCNDVAGRTEERTEEKEHQDRQSLPCCVQGRRDISAESPKTAVCDAHVRAQADLAGGFNQCCADKLRLPRRPPRSPTIHLIPFEPTKELQRFRGDPTQTHAQEKRRHGLVIQRHSACSSCCEC